MMVRNLIFVLAGMAASVATAETVAWWRFADKGPQGGVTVKGDVFTNTVDAALFPAHPEVFYSCAATKIDVPGMMPVATNFAEGAETLRIYDPVSGETHETRTAMYCPWGGDNSKTNGGLWVANDRRLIGQGPGDSGCFTFECFFRTTKAGLERTMRMEALAGQFSVSDGGTWDIMIYDQCLWARCNCTNAAGAKVHGSVYSSTKVTPDKWHHAAITFSTNATYRLFLDYKQVGAETIAGSAPGPFYLAPKTTSTPIYIAMSTYNNDRGYEGEIAEARISSEALTVDRFLRFRETSSDRLAQGDADTLLWYSFDSAASAAGGFLTEETQLQTDGFVYGAFMTSDTREVAYDATEVEGDIVRSAIRSTTSIANGGSADLRLDDGKSVGPYFRVYDTAAPVQTGDFTEEFVFKLDPDYQPSYAALDLFYSSWAKLMIQPSSKSLYLRVFTSAGGSHDNGNAGGDCYDGQWHHVAFTYDAATTTFRYYFDHQLNWTKVFTPPQTQTKPHMVGAASDRNQHPSCWVDELRITKRVLAREEFLDFDALEPRTLVRLPFNGNMHVRGFGFCPPTCGANTSSAHTPKDVAPTNVVAAAYPRINLRDGVHKSVADTGSVNFSGGHLLYGNMKSLLGRSNVTVEYFVRFKGYSGCRAALLGLASTDSIGYDSSAAGTESWRFGMQHGNWSDATLYFYCCTTNPATGGSVKVQNGVRASPAYKFTGSPVSNNVAPTDYDDKWHHVAVTIEELGEGDGVQTRVTTYWDRKRQSQATYAGKLYVPSTAKLTAGQNGSYNYRWLPCDVDELRISSGILSPAGFIHRPSAGGAAVWVR